MQTDNRPIASAAKHAALTTLGKKLRKARLNMGLTQQAVGDHLGVTGQTIRNWETGRNEPNNQAIESLASLYDLHPEELKTDTPLLPHDKHLNQARQRIDVDPPTLIEARKEAQLSQEQASNRSGIHISSIRRYERGSAKPTRTALQRLALIYGQPPLWLDPTCPNSITVLDSSRIDNALQIYLHLQPDLNDASIRAIGEFILLTHQMQSDADREQNTCSPTQ